MVEVFNLRTNELLGHASSQPICDSSSKVNVSTWHIYTSFKQSFLLQSHAKIFSIVP